MIRRSIKAGLRRLGLSIHRLEAHHEAELHLAMKIAEYGAGTLFDVGANIGQFAQGMRKRGYRGRIVSFEPLQACHAALERAAHGDAGWIVGPRMALGAAAAEADILVAENMVSSSLLPVFDNSVHAAPQSRQVGREPVAVCRLDEVVDPAWDGPYALKIDTQGFERAVLEGAAGVLDRTCLVLLEMSLTPLYEGGAGFADLYKYMEGHGFRCIGL